ncbi:ABC transporter permease [Alkalibacter rhizosphaerae]|uniref:ABC transporter permease n=1 Tax=Alkalibacter rhizosphaerae TaxID=2815577 RepID=A0A974XGP0_9FIRM|nr:ABC transporter permease [Alkalibacter rhizosphaerae]QSX09446.1 ABC transporter permease [Alkalibacter rhizosphaerae]
MKKKMGQKFWIRELLLLAALVVMIKEYDVFELWLKDVLNVDKASVEWVPLQDLVVQYLFIVLVSIFFAALIGFSFGSLIHLYQWNGLRELAIMLGGLGVTFPTVAIMALLVPAMGYGYEPVILALIIYGIFPILTATLDGFREVDQEIVLASKAMGMNKFQVFWKVEIPLAASLILAGLRTSTIISIAAATIGATVGAGGLGLPIVTGIRTNNPVLILKGALPVMLIAMLVDRLFYRLEHAKKWQ